MAESLTRTSSTCRGSQLSLPALRPRAEEPPLPRRADDGRRWALGEYSVRGDDNRGEDKSCIGWETRRDVDAEARAEAGGPAATECRRRADGGDSNGEDGGDNEVDEEECARRADVTTADERRAVPVAVAVAVDREVRGSGSSGAVAGSRDATAASASASSRLRFPRSAANCAMDALAGK